MSDNKDLDNSIDQELVEENPVNGMEASESDENKRHATWKKTNGMQMGTQTKEKWSVQKSPGCFRMHTNAWSGPSRQFLRSSP